MERKCQKGKGKKDMLDSYGRKIDYMRISITEACNLFCSYCRPGMNNNCVVDNDVLMDTLITDEEIIKIIKVAVELGIVDFKFTGGEPFARKDAIGLFEAAKKTPGVRSVSVTTNGTLLTEEMLDCLKKAGVDGINFSLDTMSEDRYEKITGCREFHKVFHNILYAEKIGICVKINTVLLPDLTKDDLLSIISLAKEHTISCRFIEQMNMGKQFKKEDDQEFVTGDDVGKFLLDQGFSISSVAERMGNGPAKYYKIEGYKGAIGFISPLGHSFCNVCSRIRVSPKGELRGCLYYPAGNKLLPELRMLNESEQIERIKQAIRQTIMEKPEAHDFMNGPSDSFMQEIGG